MLENSTFNKRRMGFTLVELMVVTALIGMLMTLLLLVVGTVRRSAQAAESLAKRNSLVMGLESYQAVASEYPPSSLPPEDSPDQETIIPGVPPGSSCGGGDDSRYIEDPPDFAGAGGGPPFDPVDGAMDPKLASGAYMLAWVLNSDSAKSVYHTPPLTLDGFGYPFLYYRATPQAPLMTTAGDISGIYNQADNVYFTGDGLDQQGLNLGAGLRHKLNYHLSESSDDEVQPNPAITDLNEAVFDNTFAKFIWDRKITARNLPFNKDTYLLISPGPDALYGTTDDVTNFAR